MPDTSTCQQYLPLKVSHVSYQVHTDLLLDNVNLEFNDLKRSIILGHNGAGKSLLLKLLHGVIQPTQGQITGINKHPIRNSIGAACYYKNPASLLVVCVITLNSY